MAPNLSDLLNESKRIFKADPRHYLILSLIFLLPLSSSSLLFQHFFKPFQQQPINPTLLFFSLLFYLFSLLFSFCAVSSITYSVFHGFFDRPVKLHDAIKSIFTSFFPLLATSIVSGVIFFFILLLFGLLLALVILVGVQFVDVTTHPYLAVLSAALLIILVLLPVVMYLQVNWSLVWVIVVVESCWGLEPLRRSASLMKGMKWVGLSSVLYFGLLQGTLVWSCGSLPTMDYTWVLVLEISPSIAMLMFFNFAVNTVLYIHCKANHGQLQLAEEEFGNERDSDGLPLIPI